MSKELSKAFTGTSAADTGIELKDTILTVSLTSDDITYIFKPASEQNDDGTYSVGIQSVTLYGYIVTSNNPVKATRIYGDIDQGDFTVIHANVNADDVGGKLEDSMRRVLREQATKWFIQSGRLWDNGHVRHGGPVLLSNLAKIYLPPEDYEAIMQSRKKPPAPTIDV